MRDRAWVRLMISGDKAAGERFVRETYPRIARLLRCLTGSEDTARDLAQQTFVKAWQALPGFRNESSLVTWLHRIAYHEYTHWLRARREHAPLEAAHNVPGPQMINDWDMVLLPEALAQLTDDLRETFLLHYVQELSVAEVASVLDVPRGTVKSRLFTARQKLREILRDAMNDPQIQVMGVAAANLPAAYRIESPPSRKFSSTLTPPESPLQEI